MLRAAVAVGLQERLWLCSLLRARSIDRPRPADSLGRVASLFLNVNCIVSFASAMQWINPRFRSDPDLGGAEKLSIALPQPIQLNKPYLELEPLHGSALSSAMVFPLRVYQFQLPTAGNLMAPFSIGYVKGWRRATALLGVLCGIKDMEINVHDLSPTFKAVWRISE